MAWRVAPEWVPSCRAAACIPLATPFRERPRRCRAPEITCARGRYSTERYERPTLSSMTACQILKDHSSSRCGQIVVISDAPQGNRSGASNEHHKGLVLLDGDNGGDRLPP